LIPFVKQFIRASLVPYFNENGELAIGYGQTIGVISATTWTQEQADEDLKQQLSNTKRLLLAKFPGANSLNTYQTNALVSLLSDVGVTKLRYSSLAVHLEERNYPAVCKAIMQFNLNGRVVSAKKTTRRHAEQVLFNKRK
jgi:GH24 family phage-related lysozyme (muramidase)